MEATSGQCTKGHYCPEGAIDPVPCKEGTYNDILGRTSDADCQNCKPGYYCPGNCCWLASLITDHNENSIPEQIFEVVGPSFYNFTMTI